MIKTDCHVHSNFSTDSVCPMEDIIQRGIELGLDTICMTDHMDYDYPKKYSSDPGIASFQFDPEAYFIKINELSERFGDRIRILKGIELGLQPHLKNKMNHLIHSYEFDFVIGSSHLVHGYDPYFPGFWETVDSEKAGYQAYFQTIIDNIKSYDGFDSYGHIDYIVRYGPNKNADYTLPRYFDVLDAILRLLIQKDKALEINTAGYKYGLGYAHPQTDVLKHYKEIGGKLLTIGSDAHKPEHLAYDFNKTCELLLSLGFDSYTVYENRTPCFHKLA